MSFDSECWSSSKATGSYFLLFFFFFYLENIVERTHRVRLPNFIFVHLTIINANKIQFPLSSCNHNFIQNLFVGFYGVMLSSVRFYLHKDVILGFPVLLMPELANRAG